MNHYKEIAEKIASVLEEKNKAYGSSFDKNGEILKILYPNGCSANDFDSMLYITRVLDKIFRIATNNCPTEEGIKDAYQDIVGYSLLALNKFQVAKDEKEKLEKMKQMERKFAEQVKEHNVIKDKEPNCECVMCFPEKKDTVSDQPNVHSLKQK